MSEADDSGKDWIHSLSDFAAFIEKDSDPEEDDRITVLYRGQRGLWPLIPSLARENFADKDGLPIREIEQLLLKEFQRNSRPYLRFTPRTTWEWLAVAQHHGLPTRLLDWTVNPFMALWFAVKDPPNGSEPGVVYMLRTMDGDRARASEMNTLRCKRHAVFPPTHITERITAQIAWFTVHKHFRRQADCEPLEQSAEFEGKLTKLRIPPGKFAHLRFHLGVCGINHASVFPGLDGLCKHIGSREIYYTDEGDDSHLERRRRSDRIHTLEGSSAS